MFGRCHTFLPPSLLDVGCSFQSCWPRVFIVGFRGTEGARFCAGFWRGGHGSEPSGCVRQATSAVPDASNVPRQPSGAVRQSHLSRPSCPTSQVSRPRGVRQLFRKPPTCHVSRARWSVEPRQLSGGVRRATSAVQDCPQVT